jgi:hypothetical protein
VYSAATSPALGQRHDRPINGTHTAVAG